MTTTAIRRRAGFTLIELLVAISLAIVIASLTVAVLNSGAIDSQRTVQAADRVSGWLITAKNRAKRDGKPRGVRFTRKSYNAVSASDQTNNYLDAAQYIELPDPYVPNPAMKPTGGRVVFVYEVETDTTKVTPTPPAAAFTTVKNRSAYYVTDDTTAPGDPTTFANQVQAGSMLVLPAYATSFRLTANPSAATIQLEGVSKTVRQLSLATYPDLWAGYSNQSTTTALANPPQACHTTYQYGFQGAAQPLFGEPLLPMPSGLVIDARTSPTATTLPAALASGNVPLPATASAGALADIDILFAPSGEVMNQTAGLVALWIRNPDLDPNPFNFNTAGEQVLVAVTTKTGNVATHPVTPNTTDPFRAAKDGINAGF